MLRFILSLTILSLTTPTLATEFTLISWNVESDFHAPSDDPHEGNDPATITKQLTQLVREHNAQLVGLTEVKPDTFLQFRNGIQDGLQSKKVDFVTAASGGADSMMIVVDAARFDIVEAFELHRFGDFVGNANNLKTGNLSSRSPLVVKLRDKQSNGTEFYFTINHLARGEEPLRLSQANMLREWAKAQELPVIAAGDFNFDYEFANNAGNPAHRAFMQGNVWKWLKPNPLVDSNWDDFDFKLPLSQRRDRYAGSILDFVFVAGPAKRWKAESSVIVRDGDFPDTDMTSDHRPMKATIAPVNN